VLWLLLLLLGDCFGFQDSSFSDERLKTNLNDADVKAMYAAVEAVRLKWFDFKYKQFFNPVFGTRQLGIIAQELEEVLPSAVGIIPKRSMGHPDDKEALVLEDVYVFNPERLFMSNVGATQELMRRVAELDVALKSASETLEQTSQDAVTGKKALEELMKLESKHQVLENLAKEAHTRSEGALKVEGLLSSLQAEGIEQKTARESFETELKVLKNALRNEIQDQASLHREIAAEIASMKTLIDQTKSTAEINTEKLKLRLAELATNEEKQTGEFHELIEILQKNQVQQEGKLASVEASFESSKAAVDELVKQIEALFKASEEDKLAIKANKAVVEEFHKDLEVFETNQNEHLLELRDSIFEVRRESQQNLSDAAREHMYGLENLSLLVKELETKVNAQAGQEIVEQRKLLEAEARIEEAKIEIERVRAEEERKSSQVLADLQESQIQRETNASIARVREEEFIRLKRELEAIQAREEATTREFEMKANHELEMQAARQATELAILEMKANTSREAALVEAEMETIRERENHDIRKEMALLQAAEDRAQTIEAIKTIFREAVSSLKQASSSPKQVAQIFLLLIALAFGIYASREALVYWRKVMEHRLGIPSLVRESSQSSMNRFLGLLNSAKGLIFRTFRESEDGFMKKGAGSIPQDFLTDVVLPKETEDQLGRIARATKASQQNETPLRNLLFYGPPGTGKTMVARRISTWCGLDYAIMSGADVAPLKDRAVTEIHNLFKWATQTPKGVMLFIDEADAFLASRDSSAGISESLRNALTALLYHTGQPSCRVMLVLATNRPHDLDAAIRDRIDESVHFDLPSEEHRRQLLKQYFSQSVATNIIIPETFNEVATFSQIASKTTGFSGREIAKLMTAVQAHHFGMHVGGDGKPAQKPSLQEHLLWKTIDRATREHVKRQRELPNFTKSA